MAEYKGYLLKINGTELPGQYIQDYSSTPNQEQDKNSYQDLTGNSIARSCRIRDQNRIQDSADVTGREDSFPIIFPESEKTPGDIG